MANLIKKIHTKDFRQHAKAMRACKIANSCELEGKQGRLLLDFSNYEANNCVVSIKRNSGNGQVIFTTGDNEYETLEKSIKSKSWEHVEVTLNDNKTLEIKRPPSSIGSVEISVIRLFSDEPVKNYKAKDWVNILNQCHEYHQIKVDGDKLVAAEGGMIKTSGIKLINTNPPNVYTVNNNTIRFRVACEIIDLELKQANNNFKRPLFPHIDSEPKVQLPKHIAEIYDGATLNFSANKPLKQLKAVENNAELPINIIYDSYTLNIVNNWLGSGATLNGKSVILKGKGALSIPLKNVKKNTEYVVALNVKKNTGNGKFNITFSSDDKDIDSRSGEAYFNSSTLRFSLDAGNNDSINYLKIKKMGNSGEIIINRVMVIASPVPSKATIDGIVQRILNQYDAASGQFGLSIIENDPITKISKRYSIHKPLDINEEEKILNVFGDLVVGTFSAASWYSKIGPLFPNIKYTRGQPTLNQLFFGSVGALHKASSIYIEEFNNEQLTDVDKEILSETATIYSPSSNNIEHLETILPNKEIKSWYKIWPYVKPKEPYFKPKGYVLTFCRDKDNLDKLIKAYDFQNMPKLVIAGLRGKCPKFALPINEYLDYPQMIWFIENAHCIVDLPKHTNYRSGMQMLASSLGTRIVTNNRGLNDPEFLYIDTNIENIKDSLEKALNMGKLERSNQNYNNLVKMIMWEVFDSHLEQ